MFTQARPDPHQLATSTSDRHWVLNLPRCLITPGLDHPKAANSTFFSRSRYYLTHIVQVLWHWCRMGRKVLRRVGYMYEQDGFLAILAGRFSPLPGATSIITNYPSWPQTSAYFEVPITNVIAAGPRVVTSRMPGPLSFQDAG